ncbi:MAG: hypothetical protein JOY95_00795 [Silvibacterium sp.]|nr:hypothetical protein [Silvibacterium sp.]
MFKVAEQTPSIKPGRAIGIVVVAVIIVLVAVAAYVVMNRVAPTAEGQISAVSLYQPLPAQMPNSTLPPPNNGLIALVPVKVRNVSTKPLSVQELTAVVRLGDTDYKSYSASPSDFDKVFQYYPDLEADHKPPFLRHSQIPPGSELQGLAIFNFALSEDQWKQASAFWVEATFDTTPYVLRLIWPTFPAHQHIEAVLPPVIPQAPPEKPPAP